MGFSDWAMKNRKSVNGQQRHELTYEACYNEATIYGIPDGDGNYTGPASEEDAKAYAQEMADFMLMPNMMLTGRMLFP